MISIEQIRAARAMLGLDQKELARRAGVSIATYNNIERQAQRAPKTSTLKAIKAALESCGIEFVNDAQGRQGLYLKPQEAASKAQTILIVDDNRNDRLLFRRWLEHIADKNIRVIETTNGKAGLDACQAYHPQCMILDFVMYGIDGFQLLTTLKQGAATLPPVIMVTGMPSDAVEKKARAHGVHTFLSKSKLSRDDFCGAVERLLVA